MSTPTTNAPSAAIIAELNSPSTVGPFIRALKKVYD